MCLQVLKIKSKHVSAAQIQSECLSIRIIFSACCQVFSNEKVNTMIAKRLMWYVCLGLSWIFYVVVFGVLLCQVYMGRKTKKTQL